MTREEREKELWGAISGCGEFYLCASGDATVLDGLVYPPELIQLRDALNHRIRELGVEDPLEKEIGGMKERIEDLEDPWLDYDTPCYGDD